MPLRKLTARIACFFCIGLVLALPARPVHAGSSRMPTGKQLTATVTELDTNLFAAYNNCDLVSFARYVAPNIEFYHDKGGLTVGRPKLVESIRNNICGKLRRVLVPGTLEVFPVPGYGALETGADRFCDLHTGNCDAFSKFAQLWEYHNGTWFLSRVFSYDHHIEPCTAREASSPACRIVK
jgi:hypothetical protein